MSERSAPFLPHWHVREVERHDERTYEVKDSRGALVAAEVKTIEIARLFALAPFVFAHFKQLEAEAVRALWHMLDANEGICGIEDVADDLTGECEAHSPGSSDYAQWLIDLRELRETVGEQEFPPAGTAWQAQLFAG